VEARRLLPTASIRQSLPDGANIGADPFKKSSAMARSPEKRVKSSGRQPGTPPAGEKSSPKGDDEEQEDVLKQLTGLGSL